MDKNTKMHAEYRAEVCRANGEWRPYNDGVSDSVKHANKILEVARAFLPERRGYKHRIAVRLVGDWCEMKENGK